LSIDTDLFPVSAVYEGAAVDNATSDAEPVDTTSVANTAQSECPYTDASPACKAAQCRELLRLLIDASYICDDVAGLNNLGASLEAAYADLQTFLPVDSGLLLCNIPTRKRGKRVMRGGRKNCRSALMGNAVTESVADDNPMSTTSTRTALRSNGRKRTFEDTPQSQKEVQFDASMPDNGGRTRHRNGMYNTSFAFLFLQRFEASAVLAIAIPSVCLSVRHTPHNTGTVRDSDKPSITIKLESKTGFPTIQQSRSWVAPKCPKMGFKYPNLTLFGQNLMIIIMLLYYIVDKRNDKHAATQDRTVNTTQ